MTPSELYQQQIELGKIRHDPAQRAVLPQLDKLTQLLCERRESSWLASLFGGRSAPVQGLYLWGGTGIGKTHLMDLFFESLVDVPGIRAHFDVFMQDVHERLSHLPKTPDPLQRVAEDLAAETQVICLDEFHVDDITDAMILAGLLEALFAHGIVLVTTSNIPVEALYRNGLQRDRFLPAISLLQSHTQVIHLQGDEDYRRRMLAEEGVYHVTDDESLASELLMHNYFVYCESPPVGPIPLQINGRDISVLSATEQLLWIDFAELCDSFRSSADYIALAARYSVVLVGHVPRMADGQNDIAQRFIHFVDAMYDHRVKLILSAEDVPENLYTGTRLAFAFDRTASRLLEMRSTHYLQAAHKAA